MLIARYIPPKTPGGRCVFGASDATKGLLSGKYSKYIAHDGSVLTRADVVEAMGYKKAKAAYLLEEYKRLNCPSFGR